MTGLPSPRSEEAVIGSVATTSGPGAHVAVVGEDTDTLAGAARDPEDVDAVLDRVLEAQRELVGQRPACPGRAGPGCPRQSLHGQHRELVGGAAGPRRRTRSRKNGRSTSSRIRPEMPCAPATPPGSCRHRRAPARGSCAAGRSSGSAGRCPGAARARSGWPRSAWPGSPAGCGSPRGGPAPCPRSIGRGLSAATSSDSRTSGCPTFSHWKPRSQRKPSITSVPTRPPTRAGTLQDAHRQTGLPPTPVRR